MVRAGFLRGELENRGVSRRDFIAFCGGTIDSIFGGWKLVRRDKREGA